VIAPNSGVINEATMLLTGVSRATKDPTPIQRKMCQDFIGEGLPARCLYYTYFLIKTQGL
jgi:hypothetical protein